MKEGFLIFFVYSAVLCALYCLMECFCFYRNNNAKKQKENGVDLFGRRAHGFRNLYTHWFWFGIFIMVLFGGYYYRRPELTDSSGIWFSGIWTTIGFLMALLYHILRRTGEKTKGD